MAANPGTLCLQPYESDLLIYITCDLTYGLIYLGIFLNCLTVSLIGWRRWRGSQPGLGLRRFIDKAEQQKIGHAKPHLLADTLKIAITAWFPFLLIALMDC
jgi:hypothetical protein